MESRAGSPVLLAYVLVVTFIIPRDGKYLTIYYFFPDYRGSEELAGVFNGLSSGFAIFWWLLPWMIGLGVVVALTKALWKRPVAFLARVWASLGPRSLRRDESDQPPLTSPQTNRRVPEPPASEPTGFQEARAVSIVPASRMRDALDITNIVVSSAVLLSFAIVLLMGGGMLWGEVAHFFTGDRREEWNEAWVPLSIFACTLPILALAKLIHRRVLALLYLILLVPVGLLLLLYVASVDSRVWSEQLTHAAPTFAGQDWQAVFSPLAAHSHPTTGLLGAAVALGLIWLGEAWRQMRWGLSALAGFAAQVGGIALIVLGCGWLAVGAFPMLWPLETAVERCLVWLTKGWDGLVPLFLPGLTVAFSIGVGAVLFVLAAITVFAFVRPAYLITFSRRLTYASARQPTPKKLWPHFLMFTGFSPANYLGIHSRRLSKLLHFIARAAGAVSFWALVVLVISGRSFLTIPMFENLLGDPSANDRIFAPALGVCLMALAAAVVFALLGNRFRPRVLETFSGRQADKMVLFLRPFSDNRGSFDTLAWAPWRPVDSPTNLAETLLDTAGCWAPVVAIGRPEDEYEPHGPAPIYVRDSDWQVVVADLAKQASAIVVLLDESEGLRWEIGHIRSCGYLNKTMFLFRSKASRENKRLASLLHVSLPAKSGRVPICLVWREGGWEYWTSSGYSASDLRVTLMRWFLLRFGHPPDAWAVPNLRPA